MEQPTQHPFRPDSAGEPAGIVAFDVLRTLIAARQSASPTVRALAGLAEHRSHADGGADPLIRLFASGTATNARLGAFASGEAVITQDERHA